MNPADTHIADLIEDLCDDAKRCSFHSDKDKKQRLIDQIAQLRASMEPTIIQKIKKD
jgi:hypothetical protein